MSAEKEIVNFWLNTKGFFTKKNIRVKENKYISLLATIFKQGSLKEFWHVEVSCSISASVIDAKNIEKAIKKNVEPRFNDKKVSAKVKEYIKKYGVEDFDYKKVFVTSNLPISKKDDMLLAFSERGIKLIEFEDIISEVISKLKTQYHKDDVIRTMQLMKYLLIAKPKRLASLISEKDSLKYQRRDTFIKSLLRHDETRRTLAKRSIEADVLEMLKNSTLKRPKKLAQVIIRDVLGEKSIRRFFNALFEQEKVKKIFGKKEERCKELDKKQKKLKYFFEAR